MSPFPMRVLIVDDPEHGARVEDLLDAAAGARMTSHRVTAHEDGVRAIESDDFDAVLVGDRVGRCSVLDFLVDSRVVAAGVPLVVLGGADAPDLDQTALEVGAADYLPRSELTPSLLERSVRHAVERRKRYRAEAQFRALIGSSRELIAVVNTDGSLRFVSPSIRRMLGFDAAERTGSNPLEDDVHPDDRPGVRGALAEVVRDPSRSVRVQYRIRHADGRYRVLDTIAENRLDDADIRGLVLSSWDVTERVADEERIRFQAQMLEAVGQAVIATDVEGRITYWSASAERFYGWTEQEAAGRPVQEITPVSESPTATAGHTSAPAGGGPWTGELEVRRKDGTPFPALVTNAPLRDRDGRVVGMVGVSSDLTEIKATEGALRARVKELRALNLSGVLLNRRDLPIRERLQRVVEVIPSGWIHPDATEARLVLDGRTFATPGFRETEWMISAVVPTSDDPPGRLEIALTDVPADPDEAPFLIEERELLETLARTIGEAFERERLTQLLSQTFLALDDAIVILDAVDDRRVVRDVNPAALRMFGFSRDEFVGHTPEKAHPDRASFERFGREARPVLERGEVFRGTFPLRRKDGTIMHAEQAVSLLSPEKGIEGGAVTIVRDVSRRVEAEKALRASEERFRLIAEHVDSVFWVSAIGSDRAEYVSPAWERIWGRPVEEFHANPTSWTDSILPEDRERVLRTTRSGHEGYALLYRIRRPDGEVRWIQDRTFPVRDESGRSVRIVGVADDITDRKLAEERFTILSQEIADVIYSVAPDGTVRTASSSAERVTGLSREAFEGTNALDLIHEEDRDEVRTRIAEVAARPGGVVRVEHRILDQAGGERHIESVARNLLDHPGIGAIVVTSRDVSERQLRQGQKMEAIGRLAGGIAHDFNNILTVIRSQTELLIMDLPDGPLAEELAVIQSAADRASKLTSQLLAFSREQILRPRTGDLGDVVRNLAPLLDRIIGGEVAVRHELSAEPVMAHIDPDQLEQALLNLAVNARDAMPDGGTLTLGTYAETLGAEDVARLPGLTPGPYGVLRIADTGVGMSAQLRGRIFDPFFTTKPRGKGTGLGLAMAYGFVKQSGGGIHVESEPGAGSTFHLRFPLLGEPRSGGTGGSTDEHESLVLADPDAQASGSILLVEDDATVRDVACKVLERSGYEVHAVGQAEEAVELLRRDGAFDALLTDLVLPGMGGRELIEHVRGMRPDLPLVVMSGYAEAPPGAAGDLPADIRFLQKPFTREAVLDAVRSALLER